MRQVQKIRYGKQFAEKGINVNYVEYIDDVLCIRTYERGVEEETYSCGTGVTAVAIAASLKSPDPNGQYNISIKTKGGLLQVRFEKNGENFEDIWLTGPVQKVYEGSYGLKHLK